MDGCAGMAVVVKPPAGDVDGTPVDHDPTASDWFPGWFPDWARADAAATHQAILNKARMNAPIPVVFSSGRNGLKRRERRCDTISTIRSSVRADDNSLVSA